MVGADARLVVARYLARRTRLDRQLHTRRSCGLVAESGRVAARDRLSRRPPARVRDPDARRGARRAASEPKTPQFPRPMADRRRGGLGPDRLSHLSPSAPQLYPATAGHRPLAVKTLTERKSG